MAGTIHQPCRHGSSKSADEKQGHGLHRKPRHKSYRLFRKDNFNSEEGSEKLHSKHKSYVDPLWVHASYTTPQFRRKVPSQTHYRDPSDMELHHNASRARKTFVASLRECTKNIDLCTGTKLHEDISKRGLLKECSDALVTMYAKCGALFKAQELLDMYKCRSLFSWTALIAGYTRQGQVQNALTCFQCMQRNGLSPDAVTLACILKACGTLKSLDKGEQIHDEIARQGLLRNNIVLGNALVDMYARCGALAKAHHVLEELPSRDIGSWNVLIAGYTRQGEGEQALSCFEQMQEEGLFPDAKTFACILKACGNLKDVEKGEKINREIDVQGLLGNDIVLGNTLVDMYAKCGALTKAQRVLEDLPSRDTVTWNSLITGYVQQGHGEQALDCLEMMQSEGISPDTITFTCILNACGSTKAVKKGEQIHDEIVKLGLLGNNVVLGNALVDMYAKCGELAKAQQVLEEIPSRDVISWNALIAGYVQEGEGVPALNCFEQMKHEGICPDELTFSCILKACGGIRAIDKGEQIHHEIIRRGLLGNNVVLGTALVDMYAKCGALAKAQDVLEKLPFRDVVSWNALIAGYAQRGENEHAMNCFEQMQCEGILPDAGTFACILKAYGTMGMADKGEQIHDEIKKQGLLGNDIVLGTALVDMYAKCGALAKAQHVLKELPSRNVASWSALIAGYAQQGQDEQALKCLEQMQCDGLSSDAVTLASMLKACGSIGATNRGEQIHVEIARHGWLGYNTIVSNALVSMYAKCGSLTKAARVLEDLRDPDVVSWNALITGYVQHGQNEQALNCFEWMQHKGFSPDGLTFSFILKACGVIGALDKGEQIHYKIAKEKLLESDIVLGTALVDMYAKNGALAKALQVLMELPFRDVVSWSALIAGYAQQAEGEQALSCLGCMQREGLSPNVVTLSILLNTFSHSGLVEDGHICFENIITKHGLKLDVEHYTCVVDLLGRAGQFNKAVSMIQEIPSSHYTSVWSALLGACQKWQDVNVGRWAFERAVEADKDNATAYVLMANIYAAAGMPEDAEMVHAMRMENEAWNKPVHTL